MSQLFALAVLDMSNTVYRFCKAHRKKFMCIALEEINYIIIIIIIIWVGYLGST